MNQVLQVFEVLNEDKHVCFITDFSLAEAIDQAKLEVAEVFDLPTDHVSVSAVSPTQMIDGKPAYQHILACSKHLPQRITD